MVKKIPRADRRANHIATDTVVDADEHPRPEVTPEGLARLRPVFKQGGTVTAGNASGLNDGAAAMLVASERAVKEHGLKPLARFAGYGVAGLEPNFMGMGPVPASSRALERAGLTAQDLSISEVNEAFAAQCLAVGQDLGFDPAKAATQGQACLGHHLDPAAAGGCRRPRFQTVKTVAGLRPPYLCG